MDIKRTYSYALRKRSEKNWTVRVRVRYLNGQIEFSPHFTFEDENAWDKEELMFRENAVSKKGLDSLAMTKMLRKVVDDLEYCFRYFEHMEIIPQRAQLRDYYMEYAYGQYMEKKHQTEIQKALNDRSWLEAELQNIRMQLDQSIKAEAEKYFASAQYKAQSQEESMNKVIFPYFDKFVKEYGKKSMWAPSRYKIFKVIRNDLLGYDDQLTFSGLNEQGLTDFLEYLQDKKVYYHKKKAGMDEAAIVSEGNTNTTIKAKLSRLKIFLRWATDKGLNTCKDFERYTFSGKNTQQKVVFLTKDELEKLKNFVIPIKYNYLEKVRDIFIFCCYTGLRFSDAQNLKYTDIVNDTIDITTIKTGKSVRIELNESSRAIVEKYRSYKFPDNVVFPHLSNQKVNKDLYDLCKMVGIDEPVRKTTYKGNKRIDVVYKKYELIGTHTGRRTFICNALSMGIPADVVMKWTGHSNYNAMKPYIDIVDEVKKEEMKKFDNISYKAQESETNATSTPSNLNGTSTPSAIKATKGTSTPSATKTRKATKATNATSTPDAPKRKKRTIKTK